MPSKEIKVTQRAEHTVTVTVAEFREAFNLPDNCEIVLYTPGGPAWHASNTDVASISKFVATWYEVKSVDTNSLSELT